MTGNPPNLLSGGNPQIAHAEGDAAVQAYIAAMPGWKRAVGMELDRVICNAVPGVRKMVKWNTPFYGMSDGWFLGFHCLTRYVKVAFLRGAELVPVPPVSSKVEGTRYWHIGEGEAVNASQLEEWVRQASALPGVPL